MTSSRANKNDNSSSSESYTDSSKCEKKPQNQKTQTVKENKQTNQNHSTDTNNLNDKMENCIRFIKYSDKKVGKKLEKLNGKINNVAKNIDNYELIVNRLRKEKFLMVNGSDAYGMFYSHSAQSIEPNNPIAFEKKSHVLNLRLDHCFKSIKVKRSGMYVINLTCQFEQTGQIALFINDTPELSSLTSTNTPLNFVTIHQILNLNKGDCLSVRNYLTAYPLTTSTSTAGIIPESKNVCLNIWKIAPEHKKSAFPPKQNKKAWCYFSDSDTSDSSSDSDSSDSDTDSDTSSCSKSSHHRKSSDCEFEESSELSESCFANPGKYSGN